MKKTIDFELYIIKATYLFMNKSTGNREAQKSTWYNPTSQG